MRIFQASRAAILAGTGLLFSIFIVPAHAAIVFGTITFDDHALTTELATDPYVETVVGVTVTVSSPTHIHLGDWDGDGSPDLYNHANITQTLTFSRPVNILGFTVVDESGGFGTNNAFVNDAGGTFNVSALDLDALDFFDVAANGAGIWEGITSFSWTQPSGDLTIDNFQFSAVLVPAAIWFGISGIAALSRFARRRR